MLAAPLRASAQRMTRSATATPSAGYASVALDPGYTDENYSESVVETLKEKYGLNLAGASKNSSFQWEALDTLPPGLALDPSSGLIFGTPVRARPQPYVFRLHVVDGSVTNPSPLRLQLSMTVTAGPRPGPAPVLIPIEQSGRAPAEQRQTVEQRRPAGRDDAPEGSDAVEVPSIVPHRKTTVPLTINDPNIVRVKVSVIDKDDKVLNSALTPEKLERGVAHTFVEVNLEEGESWIRISNAVTNEVYKTIRVFLKATDVDEPATPPAMEIRHSGFAPGNAKTTGITVVVNESNISRVKVTTSSVGEDRKSSTSWKGKEEALKLERGRNDYAVEVPLDPDPKHFTVVNVAEDPPGQFSALKPSLTIERAESANKSKVKIDGKLVSSDATIYPLQIAVTDPDVTKVRVVVVPWDKDKGEEKTKVTYQRVVKLSRGTEGFLEPVELPPGQDAVVHIYDLSEIAKPKEKLENMSEIPENERTDLLGKSPIKIERRDLAAAPVSTIPTNSMTTRAIVGFEQTGASAADSESKPFIDFFFTAPIRFRPRKDELPRFSTWGQVRLAALPQQVSTFGTFASNFVNPLAEGKLVNLVQGFDFMAGLEARIFGTNKSYVGLIPGVKQQTFMHVVAGGGAISPLSTPRSGAQIFAVPGADSPQRQLFIDRFGQEAANKQYIAFVFPDRDRFLRQYYAGVRFKTFYYAGDGSLINRFPAMLDVTVGQNEAVTGGKLKTEVTNEKGRIIGRKRNYVLRLEAFYPFPVKEASFLYLYGTAMMKVGGGGVKINTPLFLNTAPSNISITGDNVFVAPTLQSNRDYYRFGIGVNLNDLFNRKPPPEEK